MTDSQSHRPLDDQEVAQLLSGKVDSATRRSLLARLAADPCGRTLLAMALEALEAAESKAGDPDRRAA